MQRERPKEMAKSQKKKKNGSFFGSFCCDSGVMNPSSIHEDGVQSLASLSGLRILRCSELWCRSAVTAPIQLLAQELPWATGVALRKKKKKSFFSSPAGNASFTSKFYLLLSRDQITLPASSVFQMPLPQNNP